MRERKVFSGVWGREPHKIFQPFTNGERICKCIYLWICLRGFWYALILSLVWPYLVPRCKSKHAKGQIHTNRAIEACRGPAGCVRSAGRTAEAGNRIQASSDRNFRPWLERGWGMGRWAPPCPDSPGSGRAWGACLPSAPTRPLHPHFWLRVEGWRTIAAHATKCLVLSIAACSFPHSDFARVFHLRICILVVCFAQNFGKTGTKWILYF